MQEVMEEGKEARDNHLGSIKMTIPTFKGKNDPKLNYGICQATFLPYCLVI